MRWKYSNALRLAVLCVLALFQFIACAAAAETVEQHYVLPHHGYFALNVPTDWKASVHQPFKTAPPTITFSPSAGTPFSVSMTAVWQKPHQTSPGKAALRKRVEYAANGIKPFATDQKIKIVEFDNKVPGYYFTATDSAPKEGGYKYLTKGWLNVEDLTVTFTVLTNDGQDDVIQSVLAMLKGAAHQQ